MGVMFVRVPAGRTKKAHPNTCVSIRHTALRNERSRRHTLVRITPKKKKTDERKTKDRTPMTLERKAKKVLYVR